MECKLEKTTIHYEIVGAGRPIVMLHGGSADHRHMVASMEPLFADHSGWKRIYPDLPGHGKSPDEDWITSQDDVLDVILQFIDAVIPGKSFVLVGMSRGGYLARGVIYHKREMVDGVFLIVPATQANRDATTMPRPTVLVRESAFVSEVKEDEKELFDLFGVVHTLTALEQMRQVFIPAFKESNELHQAKITENYEFSFPVDDPSEPYEKPALILLGRQDSEVGYRDAWAFLENYPRATFAILDRAGHFLELEQEELFRALVEEWLRRVEEFGSFEHKRGLEYLQTVVNLKK